ncbi:uncharacterized protein BDV17DRAFT_117115 [Aspergillus undulatus]|uniref:uncharacterized protein n=1 Tax=Aspergillus undulatus TaxID=1810928 RepID=UPI003CCE51D1
MRWHCMHAARSLAARPPSRLVHTCISAFLHLSSARLLSHAHSCAETDRFRRNIVAAGFDSPLPRFIPDRSSRSKVRFYASRLILWINGSVISATASHHYVDFFNLRLLYVVKARYSKAKSPSMRLSPPHSSSRICPSQSAGCTSRPALCAPVSSKQVHVPLVAAEFHCAVESIGQTLHPNNSRESRCYLTTLPSSCRSHPFGHSSRP